MSYRTKRTFPLVVVFLLVLIAALIVSHVVVIRQLADARAEVDEVRRKYGHIRVEQEQKIYVAPVGDRNKSRAFRIYIPPGHHYMLHLTETVFPDSGFALPIDCTPTETLSMWKDEVDTILSYRIHVEEESRRVLVWTEQETLFDYRLDDWVQPLEPNVETRLVTDSQKAFSPHDTIQFMRWQNSKTRRGIMLWMEPIAKWEARRTRQEDAIAQDEQGQ